MNEVHSTAIHEAGPVLSWYQLMFLRSEVRGRGIQRGSTGLSAIQIPKTVASF